MSISWGTNESIVGFTYVVKFYVPLRINYLEVHKATWIDLKNMINEKRENVL